MQQSFGTCRQTAAVGNVSRSSASSPRPSPRPRPYPRLPIRCTAIRPLRGGGRHAAKGRASRRRACVGWWGPAEGPAEEPARRGAQARLAPPHAQRTRSARAPEGIAGRSLQWSAELEPPCHRQLFKRRALAAMGMNSSPKARTNALIHAEEGKEGPPWVPRAGQDLTLRAEIYGEREKWPEWNRDAGSFVDMSGRQGGVVVEKNRDISGK